MNIVFLRKKLILGTILGFFLIFFLPFKILGATGNYLSENEKISFDGDGSMYLEFTAETNFNAHWREYDGVCMRSTYYIESPFHAGILEDLNLFSDGSCNHDQNFIAGHKYKVYLIDFTKGITPGDTEADLRAKGAIFNINDYPEINEDTLFRFDTYYNNQWWTESKKCFTFAPLITINHPVSGVEITSEFTMEIEYSNAENYDRLMIIFEDWDASSTCPLDGTPEFDEEYSKWFNYQSLPYFSDFFSTSTGTTTIFVDDLPTGDYNCVRCYFINESEGTISDELCRDYYLKVVSYIPPETTPSYYLPISNWQDYYQEHSEKFATSTPLFNALAEITEPLINWIGNIVISFQNYFDPDKAKEKGIEMGNAIPVARGYLENIDDFFGGLPISTILIFYLITALVIGIYRLVKGILAIIIP